MIVTVKSIVYGETLNKVIFKQISKKKKKKTRNNPHKKTGGITELL